MLCNNFVKEGEWEVYYDKILSLSRIRKMGREKGGRGGRIQQSLQKRDKGKRHVFTSVLNREPASSKNSNAGKKRGENKKKLFYFFTLHKDKKRGKIGKNLNPFHYLKKITE